MTLTEAEFNRIRALLHELCGLNLTPEKKYLVRSRLEPVLLKYKLRSYSELAARLEQHTDGIFRDEVIEAMATNETSFNRDGHPYEELRKGILPKLMQSLSERKQRSGIPFPRIRIWSVACSTGQEPYSIAMAILDYIEQNAAQSWTREHFWILATDISQHALQIARAGHYYDFDLDRGVPSDQRAKYFVQHGKNWMVAPQVRNMVEFRRLNMLHNFSDLVGFDLILCRNLLIYFDEPTRLSVCRRLRNSLNPGGFFMLGAAEQLPIGMEKQFIQTQFGKTIAFQVPTSP